MDRASVAVLLCLGTAWSAPRDNSDITYVRIQPLAGRPAPRAALALRESRIENLSLTIGSGGDAVRRVRSDPELPTPTPEAPPTPTPEALPTPESTTEPDTEAPVEQKFYEKQLPGPRFYSKLSYFSKAAEDDGGLSANLVGGRRRYRSRCRCERIWNCPKLQISVARCPAEYFLCCF